MTGRAFALAASFVVLAVSLLFMWANTVSDELPPAPTVTVGTAGPATPFEAEP